jgi:hypothetical protein
MMRAKTFAPPPSVASHVVEAYGYFTRPSSVRAGLIKRKSEVNDRARQRCRVH